MERRNRCRSAVAGLPRSQISSDGLADIGGHWQEALAPTLAVHAQATGVPVAVFQLQRDDLVSAKPETSQEQKHGTIAQTDRGSNIAAVDCSPRVVGRYRSWQWRRGDPASYGRHRGNESGRNLAAVLRVAKKRAHGGHNAFERRRLHALGLPLHELDRVDRGVARADPPRPCRSAHAETERQTCCRSRSL